MNNRMDQEEKSGLMLETFFTIDNGNVDQVKSHLYGYYADHKNAYVNCILPDEFTPDKNAIGAFIAVIRDGNTIRICQDSSNQFYLFTYTDGDYFCLSNNFYMMCEHIQAGSHPLTLNKTYADQLISTSMSPASLHNTLAKEISIVPMFCDVKIDCAARKVHIHENEVHFDCVDVDSAEGMALLDGWISRWASFIYAALEKHKYCGRIDLSGGYDSRTVFSIAAATGIDLNASNIFVFSEVPVTRGEAIHHKGDLETAQEIADLLGFKLNQHGTIGNKTQISGKYAYEVFKNSFEGFHRQAYLENHVYREPYFHLGGFGGEPVRGTYQGRKKWFHLIDSNPIHHNPAVYEELINDLDYLTKRSKDEYEVFRKLFTCSWGRNHFGMTTVRDLLLGRFVISPYFDLDIYNLRFPEGISKDAIFALTIQRTCPQLLSIPYSDGTDFSQKTKEYVRYLDKKYKSKVENYGSSLDLSAFAGLDVLPRDQDNLQQNGPQYLYGIFRTHRSRDLFLDEFGPYGEKLYDHADKYYLDQNKFQNTQFCGAIAAIMEFQRIVNDARLDQQIARVREVKNHYPEVEGLKEVLREWEAYKIGRLDLKVVGNAKNDITLHSISDPKAVVTKPDWYKNEEGIGTVIESTVGNLKFRFTPNANGELQIKLRGIDLRDANRERIPVWIRFRKLIVNGETVFNTAQDIWHDKVYTYKTPVKKGDAMEVTVQFEPGGE